jgi:uncharacterized damage-inducible protein DinB
MSAPERTTAVLRQQALSDLDATRDALLPWFAASDLHRSYAPGKWTAHEILVHLADAETVLLDRVRRLASEGKPLLWAFEQDAWVTRLSYRTRDLARAGRLFAAARESLIELATNFDEATLERGGVHSERGKVTLVETLIGLTRHCRHHLGQVQAIAAGVPWDPTQAVSYR